MGVLRIYEKHPQRLWINLGVEGGNRHPCQIGRPLLVFVCFLTRGRPDCVC